MTYEMIDDLWIAHRLGAVAVMAFTAAAQPEQFPPRRWPKPGDIARADAIGGGTSVIGAGAVSLAAAYAIGDVFKDAASPANVYRLMTLPVADPRRGNAVQTWPAMLLAACCCCRRPNLAQLDNCGLLPRAVPEQSSGSKHPRRQCGGCCSVTERFDPRRAADVMACGLPSMPATMEKVWISVVAAVFLVRIVQSRSWRSLI